MSWGTSRDIDRPISERLQSLAVDENESSERYVRGNRGDQNRNESRRRSRDNFQGSGGWAAGCGQRNDDRADVGRFGRSRDAGGNGYPRDNNQGAWDGRNDQGHEQRPPRKDDNNNWGDSGRANHHRDFGNVGGRDNRRNEWPRNDRNAEDWGNGGRGGWANRNDQKNDSNESGKRNCSGGWGNDLRDNSGGWNRETKNSRAPPKRNDRDGGWGNDGKDDSDESGWGNKGPNSRNNRSGGWGNERSGDSNRGTSGGRTNDFQKDRNDGWGNDRSDNFNRGNKSGRGNDSGSGWGNGRNGDSNWGNDRSDNSNRGDNVGRGNGSGGGWGNSNRGTSGGRTNDFQKDQKNDGWGNGRNVDSNWGTSDGRTNDFQKDKKTDGWGNGRNVDSNWGTSGGRTNDNVNRGWSNNEKEDNRGGFNSGGRFSRNDDNSKGETSRPAPVTYVPPESNETEEDIFSKGVRQGINFEKYNKVEVHLSGGYEIEPCNDFARMNLHPLLLNNIKRSAYSVPTPVQKYALPILMGRNQKDLMACAQTGSGKTAAFILPIMDYILNNEISPSASRPILPLALVVMPTRELVNQTFDTCQRLAFGTKVKVATLYGGVSVNHQYHKLRNGCHIVLATTGRLLDFIERGHLKLNECRFFVLDEADRMLDMGFESAIMDIVRVGQLCDDRRTMMFSATFPTGVQELAQSYLSRGYVFLSTGIVGGACADVVQEFVEVDRRSKRTKVKEIMDEIGQAKTLIFVGQKKFADFLAADLSQQGIRTTTIHGDRLQQEREIALKDFVRGSANCLVATNVAARGLDVPGVAVVINYDLPNELTEYVHRIGRTGRCGNEGRSITFYDRSDSACSQMAKGLVKILRDAKQRIPEYLLQDAGEHTSSEWPGDNEFGNYVDEGGRQMHGGLDVRDAYEGYSAEDAESNRMTVADFVNVEDSHNQRKSPLMEKDDPWGEGKDKSTEKNDLWGEGKDKSTEKNLVGEQRKDKSREKDDSWGQEAGNNQNELRSSSPLSEKYQQWAEESEQDVNVGYSDRSDPDIASLDTLKRVVDFVDDFTKRDEIN